MRQPDDIADMPQWEARGSGLYFQYRWVASFGAESDSATAAGRQCEFVARALNAQPELLAAAKALCPSDAAIGSASVEWKRLHAAIKRAEGGA